MTEAASRSRAKDQPSHQDLLEQINGRFNLLDRRFDGIEARLERGEKRFDRLEETMKDASEAREHMALSLASIQATQAAAQVAADASKNPPWYMSWKPIAAIVALALFAGAGLTALAIAGLDIVPKLTAIKDAVQP